MNKKILLDTNIIIHRETNSPINTDIGKLFNWIDRLKDKRYIHPITIQEISKHKDKKIKSTYGIKLQSYDTLAVATELPKSILDFSSKYDRNDNDRNDTKLLNEVFIGSVDCLITEDIKIHKKAKVLGISHKVFFIESYLEKVIVENPPLIDYKTLSARKESFGRINLADEFFDSFKKDYQGFETWFRRKSNEEAYVCRDKDLINAFLYIKIEDETTPYNDINPMFYPKKRLKIGTFKVELNGFRIGERFIKIIFDHAFKNKVDEIYVTIFNNTSDRERLVRLLTRFGFIYHGTKTSISGEEQVFVRQLSSVYEPMKPIASYPYVSKSSRKFLVPIIPSYHTKLLPDSILNNENPLNFQENSSFGNAILKSYVSRSINRDVKRGDIIIFYRTGGYYQSVLTTIGEIDSVEFTFNGCRDFIEKCGKRTVLTEKELIEFWNGSKYQRPFIVNFLYLYSFPKRMNLQKMIEKGVIKNMDSVPRGFQQVDDTQFETIINETGTDPYFLVQGGTL